MNIELEWKFFIWAIFKLGKNTSSLFVVERVKTIHTFGVACRDGGIP
jgi:hypothetical protein